MTRRYKAKEDTIFIFPLLSLLYIEKKRKMMNVTLIVTLIVIIITVDNILQNMKKLKDH